MTPKEPHWRVRSLWPGSAALDGGAEGLPGEEDPGLRLHKWGAYRAEESPLSSRGHADGGLGEGQAEDAALKLPRPHPGAPAGLCALKALCPVRKGVLAWDPPQTPGEPPSPLRAQAAGCSASWGPASGCRPGSPQGLTRLRGSRGLHSAGCWAHRAPLSPLLTLTHEGRGGRSGIAGQTVPQVRPHPHSPAGGSLAQPSRPGSRRRTGWGSGPAVCSARGGKRLLIRRKSLLTAPGPWRRSRAGGGGASA